MRHWLLVLMIFLVPLRGWTGDAMALAVANAPLESSAPCHGLATPLQTVSSEHHRDAVISITAHGKVENAVAAHSTCTACDICNGPALALHTRSARATPPVCIHAAPTTERFASAVPQRGCKPPIA